MRGRRTGLWLSLLAAHGCGSSTESNRADAAALDAAAPDAPLGLVPTADAREVAPDLAPDLPPDTAPDITPDAPTAYPRPEYTHLYETGLFTDRAMSAVADGIVEFRPRFVLWSDAADKQRWIKLPPGTRVDTRDMDRWTFPIGTKFFKLFSHGSNKLETRLIERYGPGPQDYWMGAFVWNAEGTDAVFAVDGAQDINGTQHDAPAQKLCPACHNGDDGRVLGFSAMQLSRTPSGPTLRDVVARGWLSDPPPADADYTPPGNDVVSTALGYLHANCGHCHNPHGTSWPDTNMNLRLRVGDKTPEDTGAYQSAVGQKLNYFVRQPGIMLRIAPGDPTTSAVIFRMSSRVTKVGMPPLATEIVDMAGVDVVTRWIASLPR
jgi:hypothetical protein